MPRTPLLSIVIPSYNEEERLPPTLVGIGRYIIAKGLDAEVIVVDDGSSDRTLEAAERTWRQELPRLDAPRLLRNPENRGKGYSIRRGVLEARGVWVLFTDADLSTPIEDFEKLYDRAVSGHHDIAIGSRALPESRVEIYQPFHRWLIGQVGNRIVRLMTGLKIHDTQCGFKLMARERVLPLVQRMVVDRFAFDVELLYLATRTGLSIAEVPVTWRNSAGSRVGLSDPLNVLVDVFATVRRYRRGVYRGVRKEGGA